MPYKIPFVDKTPHKRIKQKEKREKSTSIPIRHPELVSGSHTLTKYRGEVFLIFKLPNLQIFKSSAYLHKPPVTVP